MKIKKVKLISHTDLDALGCTILCNMAFPEVDVIYCDSHNIDKRVKHHINAKGYKKFDLTIIADITVNDEVANLINQTCPESVIIIDHHLSEKERLNSYSWVEINEIHNDFYENDKKVKSSATSLLYLYLIENKLLNPQQEKDILNFVEHVRQYDTWEWKKVYKNNKAKQLNDLYYLLGRNRFFERFINNPSLEFTEKELFLLEINEEKIQRYFNAKDKQIVFKEKYGYKFGVVFADQYVSEIGNLLAEKYPTLDLIALIDIAKNRVSYRGIHPHIDLIDFASKYEGGGHPESAGSPFDKNINTQCINDIFAVVS